MPTWSRFGHGLVKFEILRVVHFCRKSCVFLSVDNPPRRVEFASMNIETAKQGTIRVYEGVKEDLEFSAGKKLLILVLKFYTDKVVFHPAPKLLDCVDTEDGGEARSLQMEGGPVFTLAPADEPIPFQTDDGIYQIGVKALGQDERGRFCGFTVAVSEVNASPRS
jgi:hypothetical protein